MGFLEAALMEYNSECFEFSRYRKLILDAGSEIMKLKEGDWYGTDFQGFSENACSECSG